jgi:amino acid adenylation domain-containing protein
MTDINKRISNLSFAQQKLLEQKLQQKGKDATGSRSPQQTFRLAQEDLWLPQNLTDALHQLSQREKVTMFVTLLATLKILLYRYTGQEEILVATAVTDRDRISTENQTDSFINPVILSSQLEKNITFKELLNQVNRVALEAFSARELPFDKLVQEFSLEHHSIHLSIFQGFFQGTKLANRTTAGMTMEEVKGDPPLTPLENAIGDRGINLLLDRENYPFDLSLAITERDRGLLCSFEYNADLFAAATIERMAGHFQVLLSGIVANAEQPVYKLPLLTEAERHQLLVEWNETATDYPQDQCIHQLFEQQVELTPDAVAVVFEEQELTYRQLNSRANQLAHYLQKLGVKPETFVGICLERSLEMIVGLLGILKAGAAYVPLDPAYPQERIDYILSNSEAKILITSSQVLSSLPKHETQVICLDTDWEVISESNQGNPDSEVKPNNLSYVIFTSGSTGNPKGVQICHQSLVNFIKSMKGQPGLKSSDRLLAITTICFDIHTLEIYLPLTVGATIILARREVAIDGLKLADKIAKSEVSVMQATPATWQMLLTANWSGSLDLKAICGGEALPRDLANRLLEKVGGLWNIYGPTETTVWSTTREVKSNRENQYQETTESIGRPIANTQIYILDQHLQPVPIGVPGELHIGGDGVARGYLNRPELTAEKFIPNPFNEPGSRMYKTGDLARYLPDGNIEYIGRIDNQVKIRGFRIETGEIEAKLAEHPQVKEAVVIAREDNPGDKRLVAYIVSGDTVTTTSELRSFLKQKLPDYMVPSAFVTLESLPLTPNGKIDRRALPVPDSSSLYSETALVAPSSPTEEKLAAIWSQVLGIEQIGIHNNFFELGGHSLKATQVISGIRETLGVELPLRELFSHPTVAELASAIDATIQTSGTVELKAIKPRTADAVLTLSFAQERLWFLNQLEGESATYNMVSTWQLNGTISITALESAVNEIIRRHEVLRTTFKTEKGSPIQVIAEAKPIAIPVIDLQQIPETEPANLVQQWVSEEAQRPFNLATDSLVRVKLLRLSSESHLLTITIHHIVFDGWSMGVFWQELSALYKAFSCGENSPLTELPIQYADYALWQREWLKGNVLETQLNYWQQELQGAPPLLELPYDRPRPSVQTFRGGTETFQLSKELTEKLHNLSQRSGCTLFMTMLAAWSSWLYRYSGQSDILVGSPIANRNRPEIEPLIGFFVNTLVMRTQFKDDRSFADVLKNVRQTALDAYAHQDLPFEQLAIELQPSRSLSYNPLFQVMFAWQNAEMGSLEFPGISGNQIEPETVVSKFDLTLSMEETESGLTGFWEYNSDLFDRATIRRWIGQFKVLLKSIVANPEQQVAELPLLTESERERLLVEWNDTATDYPQDKCIHQLFEQQVELNPDAVAVVFEEQELTYRELNSQANKLAHYLRSLGVSSEVLVGICVERSIEMIVGLLGILKAGGAYVPIDPTYPRDRIAYMLENSQVPILLTQNHLKATLPEYQGHTISLDSDWDLISTESQENPITGVTSQNLAYIIYTSGSTGQPKGVLVAHQGLCNLASQQIRLFEVKQTSRVLQFFSISFDGAIWEIVMALCSGARLCLIPPDSVKLGSDLNALLQKHSITHMTLVPSALATLSGEDLPTLQTIIVAGEACSQELVQKWSKGRIFFNAYGPTEYTVCATVTECSDRNQKPTIGRPIANTQIYILDNLLQPVPIGVPGELHIGGAGVARGYLNRSEMTKERFISNPFSQEKEARIYKTGDLARYLPNGEIEFLGRIDYQVKIRGLRIELGEIEALLAQHPEVKEAVVIAREDIPGDKRLVAYIVSGSTFPSVSDLRDFLKQMSPDYMVPSAFVGLEKLPLTPNGKVDRRALPAPDSASLYSETAFVPPSNPTEEKLAAIWSQILAVEKIGIHDNFFTLGGHSLKATQVISGIRESFGVELPLRELFSAPTIAELAQAIDASIESSGTVEALEIQPRKASAVLTLSFAQERLWFLNQLEGDNATYNIPSAWQLNGALSITALEAAVNEIIRRHEILRTTFKTETGVPTQVIAESLEIKIPLIDLSQIPDTEKFPEIQRWISAEAQHPFNLATDPLVQVKLLRLDALEHILLLTMHHIVSDGWSMGIFWQELSALYKVFSCGKTSPLTELPIQYADYALWQRDWLKGNVLESQLTYWKEQLKDAPPLLELPYENPRPSVQTFRGGNESFQLDLELTEKLQNLSQKSGATLFMTLLAAWSSLLYRYSGRSDILVGTPIANRNRPEIEPLIGFFVNTLVMRTQFKEDRSFADILKIVRQTALDAYAHQDIPFEQLVSELQPNRSLSYNPLFQVMFSLQNASMEPPEFPGVICSDLKRESVVAKFDLWLSMEETEGGLIGEWEYNSDLFDRTTIRRWIGHFQRLLEAIVANPEQPVAQLPLLTESERHQLLVEWNETAKDYPSNKCIHQLFEAQVEKNPDAIAVVFESEQLTYRQLNSRSNQLAHYLQKLGVKPETLVGICVERSLEMVVGLLGILKAGGAYVPLDPNYPSERLTYMLSDAAVPLLLTEEKLVERLKGNAAQAVCLDSQWEELALESEENPINQTKPNNLAYLLYTSGSTGKPKGVSIEHHSPVALLNWAQSVFDIEQLSGVLASTSICFDLSVFELFLPLSCGGQVVLAQNALQLPSLSARDDVTLINTVPSAIAQLVSLNAIPPTAKTIVLAGEPLKKQLVDILYQQDTIEQIFNLYGPSEDSTYSTWFLVEKGTSRSPAIGRPISNTQVYILDQHLQPVPIGVPGELHIGGAGLARGYLHRPELTSQKFIPNPFSNEAGSRLYKTGDLARYLPDGNIEYIGRIDNQVKIRGFRIELGEIEAKLSEHPQVKEVVVIAREDIPGDKRLVAYIVSGSTVTSINPNTVIPVNTGIQDFRDFLKTKLPDYMVPSAFVILEKLPLTPNGKVDRRGLPAPDMASVSETAFVPPSNATEEKLAAIWSQILGIEKIGIHNNFFTLGGHSLKATQVISGIRETFGVELPLRQLFYHPTVAEIAPVIDASVETSGTAEADLIQPRKADAALTLSFAQERLWFLNQLEGESATYNIPSAWQLNGTLSIAALEAAVNEIIRRHESLRTTFTTDNGVPIQVIAANKQITIEAIDLQEISETEPANLVKQWVSSEAQRPFNLATDSLVRVKLLRLSSESHVLMFNIHHIVFDGWSMGVFWQELSALYKAFSGGENSPLAELPIQYADYALWQRDWLKGNVLQSQLNYWQATAQRRDAIRITLR